MKAVQNVDRSIKAISLEVKAAVKSINQEAAKCVSRGAYDKSQRLIQLGQSIKGFQADISSLKNRWKEVVRGSSAKKPKGEKTPQWEFYIPLMEGIKNLGDQATRENLNNYLETSHQVLFKPGDLMTLSNGRPTWHNTIRRCKRAMTKEGYLNEKSATVWRLTQLGTRVLAQKKLPDTKL